MPGIKTIIAIISLAAISSLYQGCYPNRDTHLLQGLQPTLYTQSEILAASLTDQYPSRFKALHRTILTLGGKTHVMKGFLSIDRNHNKIHLLAQSEMGGKLFEIQILEDSVHIISTMDIFKQEWLEQAVAKDLKHIYLPPVMSAPAAFTDSLGNLVLIDIQNDRIRQFQFKKNPMPGNLFQLLKYQELQQNRTQYIIDFAYGSKSHYPEFITIRNNRLKYRLDINVRYIIP
ncbi:MAG: DUF3261 domain-containing protein [Desulfobacteraceae bacterium]|nr:DUF3261 domain-containing protein [Desulfobacteraceae bacterium]